MQLAIVWSWLLRSFVHDPGPPHLPTTTPTKTKTIVRRPNFCQKTRFCSIWRFRGFWRDRMKRKNIADRFGARISNFLSYRIVVFIKITFFLEIPERRAPENDRDPSCQKSIWRHMMPFGVKSDPMFFGFFWFLFWPSWPGSLGIGKCGRGGANPKGGDPREPREPSSWKPLNPLNFI